MISDEELKAISEVDVNLIVKNYCLVFKIPQVEAEAAIGPVMRAQEMAQELLAYREAERKSDMLTDSAWIAGAKFGWNCGVVGDNNALQASIESRIRERVEDKKERPK